VNLQQPLLALSDQQARTVEALFERMFPADLASPGATDIGALTYIDRALAGAYRAHLVAYGTGLRAINHAAVARFGVPFSDCSVDNQDQIVRDLERGELVEASDLSPDDQRAFFDLLRSHLLEGLFADPVHGGNQAKLGWKVLGHPGIWLSHTAEENLADVPIDKGGEIRSLADVQAELRELNRDAAPAPTDEPVTPRFDEPDVILIGLGAMGGLIAPVLTAAGLRVTALEAGPWRATPDFQPDELLSSFYQRAGMSTKFLEETPRWRRHADEATRPASFSLGRMVNGVGGSVIHYGGWLRRFHPYHFRPLRHVVERWGTAAIPEGCSLADWPVSYDELEPYYDRVERLVGVAGDDLNPFIPRREPLPMPPLRPFRYGEVFKRAVLPGGLHPTAVPVGVNSVPYDGRPVTRYSAWSAGFGSFDGDRYHAALSSVPQAIATGNLDLRTNSRAICLLTDRDGHVSGVEYLDASGDKKTLSARAVILASYTFENVRLLFLSGDEQHPAGLGNNAGQLGRHFMTKMFSDVWGEFPNVVFNRHTSPAGQSVIVDDYLAEGFDSYAHGFLGGATLSAEPMALPLNIARAPLPPDVPRWGQRYKDHLRGWQHQAPLRIQPDALPYADHTLDLDPIYRDRSGLGQPVVRITYDLKENEQRLAAWMENRCEEILRAMGAAQTWRGPRFTGVCSSHDLGGCRMGLDPTVSVLDPDLQVHDTPGLYVYSGAAFPSCPGINPTLTMWAIGYRSAERLVSRMMGRDLV